MRNLSVYLISFIFLFGAVSCSQAQTSTATKEAKIKVFFHCPNGKALIEKELVKEEGVKTVVADVETKIVTVNYDDAVTNQDKLVLAIEKIGYKTEFTPEGREINKACSHDSPQGGEHHQE